MGPITVTCLQVYSFPVVTNSNFLLSSSSVQSLKDGLLSGVYVMHGQVFRNRNLSDSIFSAFVGSTFVIVVVVVVVEAMDLFFFFVYYMRFFLVLFFR